jgi:hypothetical protein
MTRPSRTPLPRNSVRAKPYPASALTSSTTEVTQTETTMEFTNQLVMLPVSKMAFQAWPVHSFGSQCVGTATASVSDLREVNRAQASGAMNTTETTVPSRVRMIWLGVQGLRAFGELTRICVAVIARPPHVYAAATSARRRRTR